MDHYRLKTLEDIHDSLMTMEASDLAFDCRDAVLALCEIVSTLATRLDALEVGKQPRRYQPRDQA